MKNTMTIRESDKAYFRRLNRNLVFEEILSLFREKAETDGLTQKKLARALDIDPGRLSRLLREPNNLQLDTISDLLLAMQSEFRFKIVPQSKEQSVSQFMSAFGTFEKQESSQNISNIVSLHDGVKNRFMESKSTLSATFEPKSDSASTNVQVATS